MAKDNQRQRVVIPNTVFIKVFYEVWRAGGSPKDVGQRFDPPLSADQVNRKSAYLRRLFPDQPLPRFTGTTQEDKLLLERLNAEQRESVAPEPTSDAGTA